MTKMTDKELLYQMLGREINDIIGSAAPQLRMFSGVATNYLIELIDPYISAFLSPDDGKLNKDAAKEFLKQETNDKINKFLKDFETRQKSE
jgi:hypothetical protein